MSNATPWWDIELESKPDFNQAMKRIYAWYEQAVIDRPPVRFTRHNAEFEEADDIWKPQWHDLKDKWFDEEYQLEKFMTQVRGKRYQGETFPVFFPNLGPVMSAAFYDCPHRVRRRHLLVRAAASRTTTSRSRSTGTTRT